MNTANLPLYAKIPTEQNILEILQSGSDDTYVFCAPETIE